MKTRWWGVELICPKHKQPCLLQLATFSADGELRYTFYCPDCKQVYNYAVFSSALQHRALMNDIDADAKESKDKRERRPIQPPIGIAPPIITEDDKKLLRDDGIEPPDDLGTDEKGDGEK